MNPQTRTILDDLVAVERLRVDTAASPDLAAKVRSLKSYQARRFERTYADLLAGDRYRGAALFFLEELYGPRDFGRRDEQFARVVPSVVRLFPQDIVDTVAMLAQLHITSEKLDLKMAEALGATRITAADYIRAWQDCGYYQQRRQQIEMTLAIGQALERHTRNRTVRTVLRMMRAPARAAGLEEIQRFLERGFDAFWQMRGSEEFLAIIRERETAVVAALDAARGDLGCIRTFGNFTLLDHLP